MSRHPLILANDMPDWPPGDPVQPLRRGVLRVWLWSLEGPEEESRAVLSRDERERANRYYFEPDRRHFTNARAGLRRLLAGTLGTSPKEVRIEYHSLGKPRLANDQAVGHCFNLSHTAGVALMAQSKGIELGADVEAIRTSHWASGIAERYFSPEEVAELRALPADKQDQAFFRFWTNKEAVVKLLGSGLGFPLPSFTTPLSPVDGESVALPTDNPLGLSDCWLQALPVGERLQASVAAAAPAESLELFRYP